MEHAPRPSGPGRSPAPSSLNGECAGPKGRVTARYVGSSNPAVVTSKVSVRGAGRDDRTASSRVAIKGPWSMRELAKSLLTKRSEPEKKAPTANGKKRKPNRQKLDPEQFNDEFIEDLDFRALPPTIPAEDFQDYLVRPRLVTATLAHVEDDTILNAVHVCVTNNLYGIKEHLLERYGEEPLAKAEFRYGYHPAHPLVMALVPVALGQAILRIQAEEALPIHENFVIDIEHRILC